MHRITTCSHATKGKSFQIIRNCRKKAHRRSSRRHFSTLPLSSVPYDICIFTDPEERETKETIEKSLEALERKRIDATETHANVKIEDERLEESRALCLAFDRDNSSPDCIWDRG